MDIDKNIFREYDIRGTYGKNINDDISYDIGRAYGTYIKKFNQNTCIIGHDNRLSSPTINISLITGILSTGVDVINIGLVTTPMLYYARILKNIKPVIMITASHNPRDDNGFKLSFNDLSNAKGEEIYKFRDFLLERSFNEGLGNIYEYDIKDEYIDLIKSSLNFGDRKVKVVIDCGNGTTSIIANELYSMFNIDLIRLYDKSDGRFPNHHPDPIVEDNLKDLKKKVIEENADIGIAFDGDGDRAGFVNELGEVITSDEYAIIMLRDMLTHGRNKKVVYDIKCSLMLKDEILKLGGTPFENRTGASYMMARVIDDKMLFGIEYSGHIYFNDRFPPITSGLYAGLRLIEILSKTDKKVSKLLKGANKYYSTKEIKVEFDDNIKFSIINKVKEYAINKNYNISELDGIKVYFKDGWALVRCSNTGPNITLRFEATSENRLEEIKIEFMNLINSYR